jgi:hypothetical protein
MILLDVDFFMDSQGPYAVVSITDEDSGRIYKRSSDGEWEPQDGLPVDEQTVAELEALYDDYAEAQAEDEYCSHKEERKLGLD